MGSLVRVSGFALRFDRPYSIADSRVRTGRFLEIVDRWAFRDLDYVHLLVEHRDQIFASTTRGTLALSPCQEGLWFDAVLDRNARGVEEILRRHRNGELRHASWGMENIRYAWERVDGRPADPATGAVRRVVASAIHDVSLTSTPACSDTTAAFYVNT